MKTVATASVRSGVEVSNIGDLNPATRDATLSIQLYFHNPHVLLGKTDCTGSKINETINHITK